MNDNLSGKLVGDIRNIEAVVTRVASGFSVTVVMLENERTRVLVQRTVDSHFEAGTLAEAVASKNSIPSHRVAAVSR
jgi:hypothetical protein